MSYQPPPPPPGQPPQGPSYQGPAHQGPPSQGPSYQGPPPPQGQPPAAPPGQWGQPQGGPPSQWGGPAGGPSRPGGSFDPKTVDPLDWGILAAGVLAFIFSFVSYYTYSISGVAGSGSLNAWHGFFGWFAMLLALIGSAAVAVELFMPQVKLPFANRLIGLAAYALAVICVILALFVVPDPYGVSGFDKGHGFGYWISLIVIIAGAVLSFLRFQRTGGQLPIGGNRPGGTSQPPTGGYGPPPGPPPAH